MPEFTVKCSLARLGALPEIRKEIDKQVATHHALGLRGFHVATHTALRELKAGGAPAVFDQSWWNRCFNSCGTLKGRRNICTKDAAIEQSIQELFGGASTIDADRAWPFINELSKSAVTMTQNMMAANFHTQLMKAMKREVVIYEWAHNLRIDKKVKWIITHHFTRSACGYQRLPALPDNAPLELLEQLQALVALWKNKFSSKVPACPTETFIYNQKPRLDSGRKFLTGIWEWMFTMQQHRVECLERLQTVLPETHPKSAASTFKSCAKALAPLPMMSFNVPHIGVSQDNGLQSLCRGANIPIVKDFYTIFPNLRRLDRGCKCHYMRTDGVSVCLVMERPGPQIKKKRKREQAKDDANNGGPDRGPAPRVPHDTQRLVGIDPGRRDMIAVKSNKGDAFTISTKCMRHMAGTTEAAKRTNALLSRTVIGSSNLYTKLQTLPSRKDSDQWSNYLLHILPLMDTIISTYQIKSLRRRRFQSFMKRDRTLDTFCKRITASKENVLVAFGDASSCHTGFGYAPAPQGRLRMRLSLLHGAKVTLVDEYHTSQYCCLCHHELLQPKASHSVEKVEASKKLKRKLEKGHFRKKNEQKYEEKPHGLRYCSFCWTMDCSPTFHHRDLNSAQNIMDIYLSLAEHGHRPEVFTRTSQG